MQEDIKLIETGQQCPFCLNPTIKEMGQFGYMFICKPCKAWVSADRSTGEGLGFVAKKPLRDTRSDYKAIERRLLSNKWFTHEGINNVIQAKFKQNKANIYNLTSRQINQLIEVFSRFDTIKTNEPYRKAANIKADLKLHNC